jgi:hypothetical protein
VFGYGASRLGLVELFVLPPMSLCVARFRAVWFATLVEMGWEGRAMLSRHFDCR